MQESTKQMKSFWPACLVPLLGWDPKYERSWLRPDLIAGLTVDALVIPKSLGYAGIAIVLIEYSLYAAAAGAILYTAFGTSLLVIFGLRFPALRVPGTLVLVVGDLLASSAFGLDDRGLTLMGEVPSGLPSLALPDLGVVLDNLLVIESASIGLLLIGFSQSAGEARAFAAKHK